MRPYHSPGGEALLEAIKPKARFKRLPKAGIIVLEEMHELAITQSVLDIALEHAGNRQARRIAKIDLVIGEMSAIVEECVQFYFDFISRGTIASGASLCFKRVPPRGRCRRCDKVFPLNGLNWTCPLCHGDSIEVVAGREFYVESIEIE